MRISSSLAFGLASLLAVAGCQRSESKLSTAVDCARVAETLATFELGAAAKPDARAPVVAKHRAACASTQTTADEARCLFGAKDTWAARACLPRMFAAPAPSGAAPGCDLVATRMREAVLGQAQGSDAAAAVDQMMPVVRASCEQDGWPVAVIDCMGRAQPGDMSAFQACANQLPQELQEKLGQRLMAQQMAQQPGGEAPPSPAPSK